MPEPDIAFATLERGGDGRFQTLRRELGVESFGLSLMRLDPGQRGRIHSHERQEEVYLVLAGRLTLVVEGAEHVIEPDRLVRVGPDVRRQLVNAGPEQLLILALGGSGDYAGRDGRAWASWEEGGPGRPPQEVPPPDDLP